MPANPFSDSLSVKVSGDSADARKALGRLQGSILSTRKLALGLGGVLAGALAVKGLGAAVDAASSFEEAMVEVQKVTDPETAAELANRMRDLATEIPVSANELAGLAADAARFGIRGTENIQQFVESVAKMSVATDLSTQEAGEAFAKLATLTDTPVSEMENLGSSVNTLSQNFATSSSEIVDSMLRSSAALSQFGLTNTEIVGFSAALNEASESSQRAGTRLKRLAQELMDPRKVEEVASALGMNVEEFKEMRRENPSRLMLEVVEAFAEGGDAADALRESLSTATRAGVAGLAQNLGPLREALGLANDSFEEGTSLQEEFEAATNTFASRVKVLRQNLNELAIRVGDKVLPELNPLLETTNDLLSGSEDLADVLGPDMASDIKDIAEAAERLIGPMADNAEEVLELGDNLMFVGKRALPTVAPMLRDLRFVLENTAAALDTVNETFDRTIELWNKIPEPLRKAGIRGALQTAAQTGNPVTMGGGPGTGIIRSARLIQQGLNGRPTAGAGASESNPPTEINVTVEGDTGVVESVSAEVVNAELQSREDRFVRVGSRPSGL